MSSSIIFRAVCQLDRSLARQPTSIWIIKKFSDICWLFSTKKIYFSDIQSTFLARLFEDHFIFIKKMKWRKKTRKIYNNLLKQFWRRIFLFFICVWLVEWLADWLAGKLGRCWVNFSCFQGKPYNTLINLAICK